MDTRFFVRLDRVKELEKVNHVEIILLRKGAKVMGEKGIRRHMLTKEELKAIKGFENITEEEALKTLEFLERFCRVIYQCYLNVNRKEQNEESENEGLK